MKDSIFLTECREEMDDAFHFIHDQYGEDTARDFLTEMDRALLKIRSDPGFFGVFEKTNCHEYVLKRFSYVIYYQEFPDTILFVALSHTRRRPGYWLKRAKDDPS